MKTANFKKVYQTETEFEANDLVQFINGVIAGNGSFKDISQYETIRDSTDKTLLETFKDDKYKLVYMGMDTLNIFHLFTITNGINKIEITMLPKMFNLNYQVV